MVQPLHCPIPQRCHNAKAMVRYMAHLDNPDKHQYNLADIVPHGGIDVSDLLLPSSSERLQLLKEMTEFIVRENIIEFADFVEYAASERFNDWFPMLTDRSSVFIHRFISSCRYKQTGYREREEP